MLNRLINIKHKSILFTVEAAAPYYLTCS